MLSYRYSRVEKEFYQGEDVLHIAQALLGKYLCTYIEGGLSVGKIVETEAYCHQNDRACHAHLQRRTKRTEIMYAAGGVAYVYLCYGIHALFNIVTNEAQKADAVLIRAIEPIEGVDLMLQRRGLGQLQYRLSSGPGTMSQALGISTMHYGTDLCGELIWIEEGERSYSPEEIQADARVGIAYAGADALLPWRFRIKDNPWCGRGQALYPQK